MHGQATVSVQRQLKEDWDNREFNYLVAEHVKRITDSLSQFAFSCNNKLAALNDKIVLLERNLDFLEAKVKILIN